MAVHTFVELRLPEAEVLEDLTGIRRDLETARSLSLRLAKFYANKAKDSEIEEALSTAILIKYGRAFSSGVRTPFRIRDVPGVSDSQIAQHETLINWRSKDIAHSVNSFEQNLAVAQFVQERVLEEGFLKVSVHENRVIGFAPGSFEHLLELLDLLLSFLDGKCAAEEERLLEIVNNLPREEFLRSRNFPIFERNGSSRASRKRAGERS